MASRAPVGSFWEYNSGSILNSVPNILWLASGMTPHAFYEELLRTPLGLGFDWPHNWWITGGEGTWWTPGARSSGKGRWIPDAPASVYFGLGARGKVLIVVPEYDIVVVTMGETEDSGWLASVWSAIASFLAA